MGDNDKMCHQQILRASLVCAPSWTSGIGARSEDSGGGDDETDDSKLDNPSTTSQDSSETALNPNSRSSSSIGPPASASMSTSAPSSQADFEHLSISVPTVYLTRKDPSSSSYHIYQIDIESSRGVSWSIYRRYSQFHKLHQQLRSQNPTIDRLSFPPKRRINSKTSTIVQDRRLKLENYLRSLCSYIEKSRPDVDRDSDPFYQFLANSTKISENLEDLSQPSS